MRFAFLLAATLIVSSYLFSQVHIREKVIIGDKASVVASYQRADDCPGVYLRQGGGVVIDPRWQGARVSRYDWEMWLAGKPVLDGDKDTIPTLIGSFRQWSYLVPTMHYTAIPESADIAFCLDPSSTFTVGPGYPGFLYLQSSQNNTSGPVGLCDDHRIGSRQCVRSPASSANP